MNAAIHSRFGVYVHFPWCRALCPYCDFAVAVPGRRGIPHRAYTDAVLAELDARSPDFRGRELDTIYFGGGTPSLWHPDCLAEVVASVRSRFSAPARHVREVTLEANPSDCTDENLAAWRAAGIDRLSIGAQSTDPRTLVTLGRDHGQGDGIRAIERARQAGFSRISADAIFGVPGHAPNAGPWLDPSVAALANTGVDHISAYELTVEPRTRFGSRARRGLLPAVPETALADMYEAVHHELVARGFEHYEISSYARPGQRSVHNQIYWHGGEYLGLGNSAASLRVRPDGSAERRTNIRSAIAYLARMSERARAPGTAHPADPLDEIVAERVSLSPFEWAIERLWLGLRTRDGVLAADLALVPGLITWLLDAELATHEGGRVRPTLTGFMVSNTIASRVVASADESQYTTM